LTFEFKYGVFNMLVHADVAEMTGDNKEWGPPVTMHLKRKLKEPPSFTKEDVNFRNGNVHITGTLVKPLTPGPHAAIVVIPGSGPQGRQTYHYRFWGEFFARHEIIALIFDKRGVGGSSGNYEQAGFDDFAADVLAAVQLLKTRKDIDRKHIGLFGISQGGWTARLAASRSKDITFLILNAGPAVTVEEQELDRIQNTLQANKFSEQDIAEALAYARLEFDAAYTGKSLGELQSAGKTARDKKWYEYVQYDNSEKELAGWRLTRFDPAPSLRKMSSPVLAIFGEQDPLVPPIHNADKMKQYLSEAGNKDVTIRIIAGADHSMEVRQILKGKKWEFPEKYWVWAKKPTIFYETIINWLSAHLGSAQE